MATYLIANEITITRQAGDLADITFTVPDILSMTGKTAKFEVIDKNRSVIINKVAPALTVAGQVITVPLLSADTQNFAGTHYWELEVTGPITIGHGNFIIAKTIIP